MGLTNWTGSKIRKTEVAVAKNYLSAEELDILNRIVTAYLEFAELQALNHTPMYMKDWIKKLDGFLELSGRKVLDNAGSISHDRAMTKALQEYESFHRKQLEEPSPVERHFVEAELSVKRIESTHRSKKTKEKK
jgi:hypothetical protein